jgi:hypothetical protein
VTGLFRAAENLAPSRKRGSPPSAPPSAPALRPTGNATTGRLRVSAVKRVTARPPVLNSHRWIPVARRRSRSSQSGADPLRYVVAWCGKNVCFPDHWRTEFHDHARLRRGEYYCPRLTPCMRQAGRKTVRLGFSHRGLTMLTPLTTRSALCGCQAVKKLTPSPRCSPGLANPRRKPSGQG